MYKNMTWLGWLSEKAFGYRGPCEDRAFELGVYLVTAHQIPKLDFAKFIA